MFKSLLRYRYKTLLILISSVSAIASIFLITALANGIISMYAQMLRTDGDIIITQKGVADTFFSDVNRSLIADVKNINGVKDVSGVVVGAGAIGPVPIAGIYGVTENRMKSYGLSRGSYPKRGEVMLGSAIASTLGDVESVELMGEWFRISGVYRSDIGFENGGVVIPIADAGRIFGKDASFLLVSLDDISRGTEKIIERIEALSDHVQVRSTTDFIESYNQFKIIRISSGVIASISFFMGFLAIVSLMSMMIHDRRYEFGIKRAVGISKSSIILQIVAEVTVLILVAFFLAYGLSLLLLEMLEHVEKFQGYLSGKIDPSLFFALLGGSVLMALVGALIPAVMAARTDPMILINKGQA